MNTSLVARTVGFVVALGTSVALVGAAVSTTGAYFTDSKDASINASTGHVKVSIDKGKLNFDDLLPGEFKTQTITYTAKGTGVQDIWLVFPTDGSAEAIVGRPDDGLGGGLGRYGHLRVTSPDGTFVSNNLSNPRASGSQDKCGIGGTGHGGSNAAAADANDFSVPYCAPANAILLQGNMPNGSSGSVDIEFGFTKLLTGPQDGPNAKVADFKIVATQPGVRPDDRVRRRDHTAGGDLMISTAHPHRGRRILGGVSLMLLFFVLVAVVASVRSGYGLYIVHTGSMTPTYRSGDLVVERSGLPYGRGDVITFEHGAGPLDLVTHRVVSVGDKGIETKGDGNTTEDSWVIAPDQVHGTVLGGMSRMGYVAYFLQQPAGVGSVMTLALSVFLLWGLFFPTRREAGARDAGPVVRIPRQRRGGRDLVLTRVEDELDPATG